MQDVRDLAGLWEGQDALVLGDGPSFREFAQSSGGAVDLGIRNTIGVNRTVERHLARFVLCLENRADPVWESIRAAQRGGWSKVIALPETAQAGELMIRTDASELLGVHVGELHGGTSPWWAAVVAAVFGAQRIGVLGVDLTTHPIWGTPSQIRKANREFAELADVLRTELGAALVNVSPAGALDSLPRAPLQTIAPRPSRSTPSYPPESAEELYRWAYSMPEYRMGDQRLRTALHWLDRHLRGDDELMDVGTGRGELVDAVRWRFGVQAFGCEIVPELTTRPHVSLIGSLTRLPFPDRAFDVVTCLDVLEHLMNPADSLAALRELWRITARVLLISVHHGDDIRAGINLHANKRPREDWLSHFDVAGLPRGELVEPPGNLEPDANSLETWRAFYR